MREIMLTPVAEPHKVAREVLFEEYQWNRIGGRAICIPPRLKLVVAPVPMSMIRLWGHRAATVEQQRH